MGVDLSNAVAELDAAVAKATSMRETEKAKNAETIKDAQEAQTAVAQARKRLDGSELDGSEHF